MTDSQALAAAKEIHGCLGHSSTCMDTTVAALAAIISKHYAPKLEAAEKMAFWVAEILCEVRDNNQTKKNLIVALAAWKATQ